MSHIEIFNFTKSFIICNRSNNYDFREHFWWILLIVNYIYYFFVTEVGKWEYKIFNNWE